MEHLAYTRMVPGTSLCRVECETCGYWSASVQSPTVCEVLTNLHRLSETDSDNETLAVAQRIAESGSAGNPADDLEIRYKALSLVVAANTFEPLMKATLIQYETYLRTGVWESAQIYMCGGCGEGFATEQLRSTHYTRCEA